MKKVIFLFLMFISLPSISQTLIGYYSFPYYNPYNYLWGVTQRNDTLWVGTDYDGTGYPFSMLYKVTKTGIVMDSLMD